MKNQRKVYVPNIAMVSSKNKNTKCVNFLNFSSKSPMAKGNTQRFNGIRRQPFLWE